MSPPRANPQHSLEARGWSGSLESVEQIRRVRGHDAQACVVNRPKTAGRAFHWLDPKDQDAAYFNAVLDLMKKAT